MYICINKSKYFNFFDLQRFSFFYIMLVQSLYFPVILWILLADFNLNEVIALLCYLLSFSIYKLLDSIYFPLFSFLFCTSFYCVHHPLQRLVLASFSLLSFTFGLLLCCRFYFQLFLVYLWRAHTIYTNRQQRPNNNTSSNNNTYTNCRCAEPKTPTAQN